jgi:hypothetical protein
VCSPTPSWGGSTTPQSPPAVKVALLEEATLGSLSVTYWLRNCFVFTSVTSGNGCLSGRHLCASLSILVLEFYLKSSGFSS